MVNQFALPTAQEIFDTYTQHDSTGQVEAIPVDFMEKAIKRWIVEYIQTEEDAKIWFDKITENYDPEGEIFEPKFEFSYRQSLVEIASRKLLSNEDIFATILC